MLRTNRSLVFFSCIAAVLIAVACNSVAKSPAGKSISSHNSQAVQADDDETTVYVTRTGKKYHLGSCRYLKKSKIAISLEKAKDRYEACKVCRPPK